MNHHLWLGKFPKMLPKNDTRTASKNKVGKCNADASFYYLINVISRPCMAVLLDQVTPFWNCFFFVGSVLSLYTSAWTFGQGSIVVRSGDFFLRDSIILALYALPWSWVHIHWQDTIKMCSRSLVISAHLLEGTASACFFLPSRPNSEETYRHIFLCHLTTCSSRKYILGLSGLVVGIN